VDFYPSISDELLKLSLAYAKQHTTISEEDVETIMHSRKTLLFDKDETWVKRGDSPMFDVAMGCYDGAEVCELVGLYILHKLTSAFPDGNIGLYRDDGLAIFKNINTRSGDNVRKKFSEILGNVGLKITVQSNLKVVNYLDVTLNLTTGKYYPSTLRPLLGKFQHRLAQEYQGCPVTRTSSTRPLRYTTIPSNPAVTRRRSGMTKTRTKETKQTDQET